MSAGETRVAVIGAGRTKFGELFDRSLISLVVEAGLNALSDANISRNDLDEIFIGTFIPELQNDQGNLAAFLCEELGLSIPITRVEAACASGGVAIYNAIRAIKSGDCDLVLVGGAEKTTDRNARVAYMAAASEWERLYDFDFIALNAMLTQQYFQKYPDINIEDFYKVSIKNHLHGIHNPNAHFRNKITLEQVKNSMVISHPVRLLECSPVSDGAAAIILASEKKARELTDNPIYIAGYGMGVDTLGLYARNNLTSLDATKKAAKAAFQRSGLTVADIDLFELHDAYIIQEILAYEDLGLAEPGKGTMLVKKAFEEFEKKALERKEKEKEKEKEVRHIVYESPVTKGHIYIVNAGGGLKSDGHPVGATGVRQICEIYHQMTGKSPYSVTNSLGRVPEVCLSQNIGGSGSNITIFILESDHHLKHRRFSSHHGRSSI